MQKRLYVLLRNDLPLPYQAVQGGHAVAEYLLRNPQTVWKNNTLIYLNAGTHEDLIDWGDRLTFEGIDWTGFREPDLGHELTAIACLNDGHIFRKLKLIGE